MLVGQQVQFVLSAERGCCTMPIRRSVVPLQFREQMQRISFPHFAHLASVINRQDRDAVRAGLQPCSVPETAEGAPLRPPFPADELATMAWLLPLQCRSWWML